MWGWIRKLFRHESDSKENWASCLHLDTMPTNCAKMVVSRTGEQDSDESIGEIPSVLKATTDGGWEDPY